MLWEVWNLKTEKPLGITFRTWIREKVVSQIRATGAYVLDDDLYNRTYSSDIEFTCVKDSEITKVENVSAKVILNFYIGNSTRYASLSKFEELNHRVRFSLKLY